MRRVNLDRFVVVAAGPVLCALGLAILATRDASSAPPSADASFFDTGSDTGFSADTRSLDARGDILLPKDVTPPPPSPGDSGKSPAKPDAPVGYDAPRPIAPDPSPLFGDALFVMTVRFDKGKISVDHTKRVALVKKEAVPRHFGRFAAELYVGPTLLERQRFNFPLIADDDLASDSYAKGLNVTVEVTLPDSDRPNKLEIWDRATDKRWSFPYPPKL